MHRILSFRSVVAVSALLAVMPAAARASAPDTTPGMALDMVLGQAAPPPAGFLDMCRRDPRECLTGDLSPERLAAASRAFGRMYWSVAFGRPLEAPAAALPDPGLPQVLATARALPPETGSPESVNVHPAASPHAVWMTRSRSTGRPFAPAGEQALMAAPAPFPAPFPAQMRLPALPGLVDAPREVFSPTPVAVWSGAVTPRPWAMPGWAEATPRPFSPGSLSSESFPSGPVPQALADAVPPSLRFPSFRPDLPEPRPVPPQPGLHALPAAPAVETVRVALDAAAWRTLNDINRNLNRAIRHTPDERQFGRADHWAVPSGRDARGDCEDYVLAKRRAALRAGFPPEALSIALVRTRWGELHAVLLVATDRGEMVLDNLSPRVLRWDQVDYVWLERQVAGDALRWARVVQG